MHISVVIPAYNEEKTIAMVIQRVLDARLAPHQWDILVVDDGSTDHTAEKVQPFAKDVRFFQHPHNQGKGHALRTAFAEARGEAVIIQDADLEYDPREYSRLIGPIVDGQADVVYGSRFQGGDCHRILYFWHSFGNRLLTIFSNMATNLNLSDMETGFKVVRADFLKKITIEENGFGIEPELTAKLALLCARFYEVGISYHGRTYEEGKKITWQDGVIAIWCIFKYGILRRLTGG